MRVKTWRAISKFLEAFIFLLVLLLEEAFPNAALAFTTLNRCAADPACLALIKGSASSAVSAPTGAGFGASTLTTTTATGYTTSAVRAAAGFAVVVAPSAAYMAWHYWNQATNERAQNKAKERYCAAYPYDPACSISYSLYGRNSNIDCNSRLLYKVTAPYGYRLVGKDTSYIACGFKFYEQFQRAKIDGTFEAIGSSNGGWVSIQSTPAPEWKDWPQDKRNAAVKLLNNSDWQDFINAIPAGGTLSSGYSVNAPQIIITGQPTDNPNTPEDERLPKKVSGSYTMSGYPDFDRDGIPDYSDPDDNNDGVPDTSDPEPEPATDGAGALSGGGKIPGIDIPFGGIDSTHPPSEAVMDKVRSMNICEGTDCSEIAEDLLKAAGYIGQIIEVKPPAGQNLTLYEYGRIQRGFLYHQVYTDGFYIFDPRVRQEPIPKGEWEEMIRTLNPGATSQYITYP